MDKNSGLQHFKIRRLLIKKYKRNTQNPEFLLPLKHRVSGSQGPSCGATQQPRCAERALFPCAWHAPGQLHTGTAPPWLLGASVFAPPEPLPIGELLAPLSSGQRIRLCHFNILWKQPLFHFIDILMLKEIEPDVMCLKNSPYSKRPQCWLLGREQEGTSHHFLSIPCESLEHTAWTRLAPTVLTNSEMLQEGPVSLFCLNDHSQTHSIYCPIHVIADSPCF